MNILGIDVGGANLKFASTDGRVAIREFALWQRREELAAELVSCVGLFSGIKAIALTMTGELADCYASKREGVIHIVDAVQTAANDIAIYIYGVDGAFHTPQSLAAQPLLAASANWHAAARFASAWLPQATGLWIDMGSTTVDIIPVLRGEIATNSQTDIDRLLAGELLYTGLTRTPLPCVVGEVELRGQPCLVAAEVFATTADVNAMLGFIEFGSQLSTADGQPHTLNHTLTRVARCVCGDRELLSDGEIMSIAKQVHLKQREQVLRGLEIVSNRHPESAGQIVVSGSGSDWLTQVLSETGAKTVGLEQISTEQQTALCAAAVAALLDQQLSGKSL